MSTPQKLIKYTENFEVSRPIFSLKFRGRSSDTEITSISVDTRNPVFKYTPTPIEGDILSEMVCNNYSESFSTRHNGFSFDRDQIAYRTMQNIRSSIEEFLEKNLPLRNPKQSKLYRWAYRNMPNTYDVNEGLLLIFQYIKTYADEDSMVISKPEYKPHLENAIALLDAMREKHEE